MYTRKNNRKNKPKKTRKSRNTKRYFTHNNGDRPYLVMVKYNKSVTVYTYPNDLPYDKIPTKDDYTVLVKSYPKVKKVFVGYSIPGDDMYLSYPSMPLKAFFEGKGNSLLLQISKNRYDFVGHKIIRFSTQEQIKEYYSMIGPNDVPYPLALSDKNVYFMITDLKKRESERISYVSRSHFEEFPEKYSWGLNGYDRLWGINDFKGDGINEADIQKIKNTIISS